MKNFALFLHEHLARGEEHAVSLFVPTPGVARYSNPGICSVRVFCGIQIPELVEMFVLKSRTETDARKNGVPPSDGTVEMGTDYHQLLFDGQ
jgi:hypothetical protein